MSENDSSKFKIRFDDEGPLDNGGTEPPLHEKVENLRLKKLSRKINLFVFLIICLVGLVFVFGYFDIRNRVDNLDISGSSGVQTISKDFDSKFSSLSIRQAKIEALLNSKISAMEKTAGRLQKNLEKTEKVLSSVRSSAPDKQELAKIVTEFEKNLSPIKSDLKKLSSELNKLSSELKKLSSDTKTLQDKLDKETARLSAAVGGLKKEIATLKTESAALASSRVDKKTFDLVVRHFEERFIPQKLNDLEKSLSEKIEALSNQIKALENRTKEISAAGTPLSEKQPIPPPGRSTKSAVPEPGKIIEQELKK